MGLGIDFHFWEIHTFNYLAKYQPPVCLFKIQSYIAQAKEYKYLGL